MGSDTYTKTSDTELTITSTVDRIVTIASIDREREMLTQRRSMLEEQIAKIDSKLEALEIVSTAATQLDVKPIDIKPVKEG